MILYIRYTIPCIYIYIYREREREIYREREREIYIERERDREIYIERERYIERDISARSFMIVAIMIVASPVHQNVRFRFGFHMI